MSTRSDSINIAHSHAADKVIRCEKLTKLYPGDILAVDRLNLSV